MRGIGACRPDHHTNQTTARRARPTAERGRPRTRRGRCQCVSESSTAKTHADVLRVRDTAADVGSAQPHVLPSQLTVDSRARQYPTSNPGQNQSRRPNITAAAYASSMRSSHQPVGAALRTVSASGLHVVVDQTLRSTHGQSDACGGFRRSRSTARASEQSVNNLPPKPRYQPD